MLRFEQPLPLFRSDVSRCRARAFVLFGNVVVLVGLPLVPLLLGVLHGRLAALHVLGQFVVPFTFVKFLLGSLRVPLRVSCLLIAARACASGLFAPAANTSEASIKVVSLKDRCPVKGGRADASRPATPVAKLISLARPVRALYSTAALRRQPAERARAEAELDIAKAEQAAGRQTLPSPVARSAQTANTSADRVAAFGANSLPKLRETLLSIERTFDLGEINITDCHACTRAALAQNSRCWMRTRSIAKW